MSAISSEGCFGIQGGGCALVILSMSIQLKAPKCVPAAALQNEEKNIFEIKEIERKKSISSYPACARFPVVSCSRAQLEFCRPEVRGLSSKSREAPRPAQCVRAGWISDYVLNKPCDCRHVSQLQTDSTPSHEPHVLDGAFNSSPPHHPAPSPCCWSTPISVVLLHRGRVPCTTTLRHLG